MYIFNVHSFRFQNDAIQLPVFQFDDKLHVNNIIIV
jgi:hypothetical protein